MKHKATLTALAFVVSASLGLAAEMSIKKMMKESMKGDKSLFKNVSLGKGTDADAKKLLEYVQELAKHDPPKGDKAAWKQKTDALIAAAKDVVDKKPNATTALGKAGSCKGCHSEHKED